MGEHGLNTARRWNDTRITERLGIEYPIIQGPLGGLSSQRLAAAVSSFGGLGSFGAHGLQPSRISEVISELRSLTEKPFAMNLWVSMEDEGAFASGEDAFARSLSAISGWIDQLGGARPSYAPYAPIKFEDQARAILDANVPVFSFIYGIPPKEILDECRRKGIVTVGAATTPEEAVALDRAAVDVIAASGFEAGGHRGSFLRGAEESLTGTLSLVPQVASLVSAPVVAAGGIADARGIVAAFALGAEAVQMGTVFLACEESGASAVHREAILGGKAERTGLTRAFTGRLARGIKNTLMDDVNRPDVNVLPYPLQRVLMRSVALPAEKAGRADLTPLWAGQSASLARFGNARALLEQLVAAVSEIAGPVLDWSARQRPEKPS